MAWSQTILISKTATVGGGTNSENQPDSSGGGGFAKRVEEFRKNREEQTPQKQATLEDVARSLALPKLKADNALTLDDDNYPSGSMTFTVNFL